MQFIINKSKLVQVLGICSKAISGTNSLPILSNILIEAKDGKVFCTTTDLDLSIQYFVEAQVVEVGSITINSRTFQTYLNLLPDNEITFISEEADITINSKKSKTKFKGIKSENFPKTLKIENGVKFGVVSDKLASSISEVSFSVSDSNARPILTGVSLTVEGNILSLLSTDSYRMSYKYININSTLEKDISIIIPAKTLNEVSKIISDFNSISSDKFEVFITISENQILFEIGDIKIYSRLIEGTFPNCKLLIPSKHSTRIVISKSDLLQAIKRLSIFAKEDSNKVILNFQGGLLLISTQLTQVGSDQTELVCSISGDDISISLNALYILDILTAISKSEVLIETNGVGSQVVFKNPGPDDGYIHIIMPLRT